MQFVSVGVGQPERRVWFRAEVIEGDAAHSQLKVRCAQDRPGDRALRVGEEVLVLARQGRDQRLFSAPMQVDHSEPGEFESVVRLRCVGDWMPENERREQLRLRVRRPAERLRCWRNGAWHSLEGEIVDLSSRGIGLELHSPLRVGERLSLVLPVDDQPALRLTIEVKHVYHDQAHGVWRGGGQFKNLLPTDHVRIVGHIFAELRAA